MTFCVQATWEDVPHLTDRQKAEMLATMPPHEREARAKGVPMLGSGPVFPVSEAAITCDAIPIPAHWAQLIGMDFGWDHPFAAVHVAWDRDADVVYVTRCYRESRATPIIHAAALRPWGAWVPCAWPHDGYQHDKGSGQQLAALYRQQGLMMLASHATHADGGYGIEAGVTMMLERMQTGRLKVFRHLNNWFEEMRLYHRKDGRIVKEQDDLMSATRITIMSLRFATTEPQPWTETRGPAGDWMGA